MLEQITSLMLALLDQTGFMGVYWGNLVMITVGAILIYLAITKKYEPFLLVGIAFACKVANVPGSDLTQPGGLFYYAECSHKVT